jgi:hypothetical protein
MRKAGTGHHFYFVVHKNTSSLHLKFNNELSKNQDEWEGNLWYKNNDLPSSEDTSGFEAVRNPYQEVFHGMVKGFSHVDRKNFPRSHFPPVRDSED